MISGALRRGLAPARRGRPWAALALVCAVAPLGGGCTVFTDYNEETENALDDFQRGNFDGALAVYKKDLDATNDSLLYHMEAGTAAHWGQKWGESTQIFDGAYTKIMKYVDEAKVTAGSVGQTAASFLVNEKTLSYDGKTFEHILVQGFQARNRFMAGDRDNVGNEIVRTRELQDEARLIFREELEAAQDAKAEKSEGVDVAGVEAKMVETYDYTDLCRPEEVYDITWIRYLNAFLKEATDGSGSARESARAEINEIAKLRPDDKVILRDLMRLEDRSTGERLRQEHGLEPVPAGAGSVALFLECGMGPKLGEVKVIFPTLHGAAAVALPKYEPTPNPAAGAVLVVGDQRCQTTSLSSVRQIAYRFHKDRLPILIAKQIVRLAAKIAVQEGGHAVIANNGGEDAQAAAALYSIGMSIWNVASEQADLRCWRTLPDSLHVARVYLPEGEYPAKVILVGPGGNSLREVDLGTISVKANRHRMVDARSVGTALFCASSKEEYDGKTGAGAGAPPTVPTTTTTDLARPDARQPDTRTESSSTTDVRRGDARQPDTRTESSSTTDARRGDARQPDTRTESSSTDDARRGDARQPDTRTESSSTDDARRGDARPKDDRTDPLAPPTTSAPTPPPAEPTEAAPAAGQASGGQASGGDAMDRLAALFAPKHPLCIQLTHGKDGETISMNTFVEEVRDERDERGRYLVVMTTNYVHDGAEHYFSFVVRDGELESLDLMAAQDGEWRAVDRGTFWFKAIPGANCEFDADGDAVLSRRGIVNRERGAKARGPVTVYVRTYQVEGAPDMDY